MLVDEPISLLLQWCLEVAPSSYAHLFTLCGPPSRPQAVSTVPNAASFPRDSLSPGVGMPSWQHVHFSAPPLSTAFSSYSLVVSVTLASPPLKYGAVLIQPPVLLFSSCKQVLSLSPKQDTGNASGPGHLSWAPNAQCNCLPGFAS